MVSPYLGYLFLPYRWSVFNKDIHFQSGLNFPIKSASETLPDLAKTSENSQKKPSKTSKKIGKNTLKKSSKYPAERAEPKNLGGRPKGSKNGSSELTM